jgi:hypothetical protein
MMKTGFVPISLEEYVELHLNSNPDTNREEITIALKEVLEDYKRFRQFVHSVHTPQVGVLSPSCPICGGINVLYVRDFHTMLPALQPVAAGMMQGEQVFAQFRVGKAQEILKSRVNH